MLPPTEMSRNEMYPNRKVIAARTSIPTFADRGFAPYNLTMGLTIAKGVPNICKVDLKLLGKISEARASSTDGLEVNHHYGDLRGCTLEELSEVLEFETSGFDALEREGFSDEAVEELDEEWIESFLLPGIDFGVASAVAALSALGCVPITSCRGKSLSDGHSHDAPTVCFYCEEAIVPLVVRFAEASGVSVENNSDMLELYSADVRLMPAFAREVALHLSH
jgi:hypothetical protein